VKALKTTAFSVVATTLLLAASCAGTTKIGDVLSNSAKYEGKEITITGTVGETVWLAAVDRGTYQLGDGTGTIWVITAQPPPQQGLSITTSGKVQAAYSILGRSYGTVLIETKRG